METFTEELKREYFSALYNQQSGNNESMKKFKEEHAELFSVVNAMYHKRSIIRENYYAMKSVSSSGVVFGALTFDSEHDVQCVATKRKQVRRHLDKFMDMYLYVEELGGEKERYHVHFLGVLKPLVTYNEFNSAWHSRVQIEKVISTNRCINYLTDYVSKQVPRLRRNQMLTRTHQHYKKSKSWTNYGFKGLAQQETNDAVIDLVFGL